MKLLNNIRNDDNESCRWFLVTYYNLVNPSKNRIDDRELFSTTYLVIKELHTVYILLNKLADKKFGICFI